MSIASYVHNLIANFQIANLKIYFSPWIVDVNYCDDVLFPKVNKITENIEY